MCLRTQLYWSAKNQWCPHGKAFSDNGQDWELKPLVYIYMDEKKFIIIVAVSSSLRKEQWTDHFGTTKDPVICDLDLVIISDKAVRRKSSVDLAVMSTIMWSYVIIDNYTYFLLFSLLLLSKLITDKDLDSFFSSITSNLTYKMTLSESLN